MIVRWIHLSIELINLFNFIIKLNKGWKQKTEIGSSRYSVNGCDGIDDCETGL